MNVGAGAVCGCYRTTQAAVISLNCYVPEMVTAHLLFFFFQGYLLSLSLFFYLLPSWWCEMSMFELLMRQYWSPVNSVILLLILLMISQKDACFILLGLPAGLSIKKRKAASETNKFIAEKQKVTHNEPTLWEEHQKKILTFSSHINSCMQRHTLLPLPTFYGYINVQKSWMYWTPWLYPIYCRN